MSDLISRKLTLKNIEKIRQSVQMMDDTHRASITMNGMYLCEKAVRNQPSAQPEPIWGLHASVGRPLGDLEIVPRLREIQKQIGGSYAIDRAVEVIEAIAERRTDGN